MELNINQALQHYSLGVKLHKLDKLDEAEVSYKKAIELKVQRANGKNRKFKSVLVGKN